ncbi:MAG: hypothetical protein FJX11_03425 [Alphaproteobacteria bacterium]|nr:hypothetical protein [Alphaproteobacteria bacterium]
MFQLLHDTSSNVLMTRLHGAYVEADIVLRDKAVARFVARHGLTRGIMDFTDVERVDVSMELIVRRCEEPPILPGQMRVIVAPYDPAYGLNRIIAAHQRYRRGIEPLLVRTLAEAYDALSIDQPAFAPIEVDAATRRDGVLTGVLSAIERARGRASLEQSERTRRTMLRLLDTVLTRGPAPVKSSLITFGNLLSTVLADARIGDADLTVTCPACRTRQPLSRCRFLAGRETSYACPACGQVLVVLLAVGQTPASPRPEGYELAGFIVRTTADIDCPGAVLPKSEP